MTTSNSEDSSEQSDNSRRPVFRELRRDESDEILRRNHVGHIAFAFHDRVNIEPIHYVFDSDWIYGRTSHGTKLATVAHNPWVAFEVAEVKDVFDWQSVVVKGAFYRVDPDTQMQWDPAFRRGVELLRSLVPETLRTEDPAPFRRSLFRIHLDEVTGREARTG